MGTGSSASWTDWTAGDGMRSGNDTDGIPFIKDLIEKYVAKVPDPNDRVGVFWAGGAANLEGMPSRRCRFLVADLHSSMIRLGESWMRRFETISVVAFLYLQNYR